MPYVRRPRYRRRPRYTRRTTQRSTRRYVRRPRRYARTRTVRNSNTGQLIAPRYITKLKYSDRLNTGTASSIGFASAVLMNLNSIFDPDRTGIGHQPLGRDQLAVLYNRYRVFAVSWRVEFFPATLTQAATFFVCPVNDAATMSNYTISQVKEQPHCVTKLSSVDKPTVFSGRVSLPKLTGQTSAQYKAGTNYESLMSGNPSELMTLQIGAVPAGGTQGPYAFDISLFYHVELFDPIPLSQS